MNRKPLPPDIMGDVLNNASGAAVAVLPAAKRLSVPSPNGTGPRKQPTVAAIKRLPRYDDEPDLRGDLADELDRITG